jgi:3-deoxy-D-manno-octulosonate 8-phosphate phosphatase (KDO 8-P phosphatase)
MKHVGLPTCPSDAAHEIQSLSKYISPLGGGMGCVRDIIEQVLRVKDKWMTEGRFEW